MKEENRTKFLLKNLSKGLIWLTVLIGFLIYANHNIDPNYIQWLAPVYDNTILMLMIFLSSEIIFGIIPPEIFMVWGTRQGDLEYFILIITILAIISYCAGLIGFWIGKFLDTTKIYRYFKRKVFGRYETYIHKFGVFVIIVASLTPIPYSGISMLIGSVKYPLKKFIVYSSMRFVRFGVYSYIIWQAHYL